MNSLGETIRLLMGRQGITGRQLAKAIGVSAASVSHFVKGRSRPMEVTFTRILECLGSDPSDKEMLLKAFFGLNSSLIEEGLLDGDPKNALVERERVERWLEARTQAITFKNSVGRELDGANVAYRRDVCEGIASADFLIETAEIRTAIECKFNVNRDFEKTIGIALLLLNLLRCQRVLVVVPFLAEFANAAKVHSPAIVVCTVPDAIAHLNQVQQ